MYEHEKLWFNIKHFSGFKTQSQNHNLDSAPVSIAYDYMNKDVSFDLFHKNLLNGSCSLKIMSLLQDLLNFGISIFDDCKFNVTNKWQLMEEENTNFLILFPLLENVPENTEFMFPLLHSRLALLYKTASEEKDLYIRNLTSDVWLYLVVTLTLVSLCFRLSVNIHHRFQPKHSDWSWPETIQLILGAISQQGSAREPLGNSCRTMFLMGYFITYMIFTAFAAGITSLLAITTDPPETQWEKSLSNEVSYVTLCNSKGHRFLQCVDSMHELIPLVEVTGLRAVLSEGNLRRYLASSISEEMRGEISVSKQTTFSHYYGFAVKKGSSLKHSMNYWLLRMKEHGLLKRVWDQCIQRVPVRHMPPGYTQVGLNHVKTAFIVIELSRIVALVIFVCEVICKRYRTNKTNIIDRTGKQINQSRQFPFPEQIMSDPGLRKVPKMFQKRF